MTVCVRMPDHPSSWYRGLHRVLCMRPTGSISKSSAEESSLGEVVNSLLPRISSVTH